MANVFHIIFVLSFFYSAISSDLQVTVREPTEPPVATVIFLHGTGESGTEAKAAIENLYAANIAELSKLRIIFPTARTIRVNSPPWNGSLTNAWVDFDSYKVDADEDTRNLKKAAKDLRKLINEQIVAGVLPKKIYIVGSGSGGTMALHMGYEYTPYVGFVAAMSAWLPTTTSLYWRLLMIPTVIAKDLAPVHFSTNDMDAVVNKSWVENTVSVFNSSGIPTTLTTLPGNSHTMTYSLLHNLFHYIELAYS